ncbi:MAG: hypothetical protein RLO81_14610, partial [Fulvivirga sp.]
MLKSALRLLLLACCALTTSHSSASHLVGGDLRVEHVNDNIYEIILTTYFDEINGAQQAIDSEVLVSIFSKTTNELLGSYQIPLASDIPIENNLSCNDNLLQYRVITYKRSITLEYQSFNDEQGFYLSWERCCRQYSLNNIFSEDPNSGGISSGFTAYCEIPSIVYQNSSPKFTTPSEVFGCVDLEFQVDVSATDQDGDSLVYSLVTPYSTVDTENAIPINPNPGPYPEVVWRDGFDNDNVFGSSSDINFNSVDGVLTIDAASTGTFAYAIKCEEYRDGIKIGEVRLDMSLLIVSACTNMDTSNPDLFAFLTNSKDALLDNQTIEVTSSDQIQLDVKIIDVPTINESAQEVGVKARIKSYYDNTVQ